MTVWHPQDDGHAELSSHEANVTGPPYNTFARRRAEGPCH